MNATTPAPLRMLTLTTFSSVRNLPVRPLRPLSARCLVLVGMLLSLCIPPLLCGQDDYERAPIEYAKSKGNNPVTALQKRIDEGKTQLDHAEHFGYLKSVLKELQVSQASQLLVFSKTSLQRHCIGPEEPRSLYFNDDSYVGFCQNGDVLEISTSDPDLGTVFYTLSQEKDEKPRFVRQTDSCLICHSSSHTQGVPGHLVRSVYADTRGEPMLASGSYRIDQTSPLDHRWGGWYVTGSKGTQKHLGNLIVNRRANPEELDNSANLSVADLKGRLNTGNLLTPYSDVVAHLVLEHQAQGHNYLTRASFETRMALHYEKALNRDLGEAPDHRWGSTTSRIKSVGDPLVKYLLFSEEAALQGSVAETTEFQREFSGAGLRDARGRSLRDFDLQRRVFKYPCSFLIYSTSFEALPAEVKGYVYQRLHDVLTGKDADKAFSHLSEEDRRAILEILLETKKGLPGYWRSERASR